VGSMIPVISARCLGLSSASRPGCTGRNWRRNSAISRNLSACLHSDGQARMGIKLWQLRPVRTRTSSPTTRILPSEHRKVSYLPWGESGRLIQVYAPHLHAFVFSPFRNTSLLSVAGIPGLKSGEAALVKTQSAKNYLIMAKASIDRTGIGYYTLSVARKRFHGQPMVPRDMIFETNTNHTARQTGLMPVIRKIGRGGGENI
jgi:hypothetical protein